MGETDKAKPVLPGNEGQFGEGDASEAFKPLEDHPPGGSDGAGDGTPGPHQTNAGERR